MDARSPVRCTLSIVVALVALAASATMAWAAAWDLASARRVPDGVTLLGHDLSGLDEAALREALIRIVRAPLTRPVTVRAAGQTWLFDPRDAVRADLDAMSEAAFAAARRRTLIERISARLIGSHHRVELAPAYTVDRTAVAAWVERLADRIERPATDASLTVIGNRVEITPSRAGARIDRERALDAILKALTPGPAPQRTVTIPIRRLEPRVTERDFGAVIVVDISERRVRLFAGERLVRSYPCAVGSASFPTPRGRFEIVAKRYMPTWVNPAPNGWGADMPRMIPPGPANPLGTRALNLSAHGIRLHGTNNIASIGTAASHGCMRMLRADIEDLYERVEVGTPVFIVD